MSFNWSNFNIDINIGPNGIANEVRRIISIDNPNITVKDFFTLMIKKMDQSNQPFEKAILDFSIAAWVYKIHKDDSIKQTFIKKWERLVVVVSEIV